MSLIRGDGSLVFGTSVDNSGLSAGTSQSMGILRSFGKNVDKLDIFAGLALSAAYAFGKIGSSAKDMAQEYQTAMKEVQTISLAVQEDYIGMSQKIIELSKEVPQSATELAKAYYQIVSAGYDGAAGLKLLETSAKGAVGGVTDVTTSADGLTTVLNAFKISAEQSDVVADKFFKTVELGKTTYGELASGISQVASLAAASKIGFGEISAAAATLTKQGTPTAQAFTQIRAAVIAMNKTLGLGWAETMTFQDGMALMAKKAADAGIGIDELTGRVEGALAILGTTGSNFDVAASDLEAIEDSFGASAAAFETMIVTAANQSLLLKNNIDAALKPLGDFLLGKSTDFKKWLNEAFESGNVEDFAKALGVATVTMLTYMSATKLASISKMDFLRTIVKVKKAVMGLNASLLKNPYVLIATAIAATVSALILYEKKLTSVEKAQEKFNKLKEDYAKTSNKEIAKLKTLITVAKDEKRSKDERAEAIKAINALSPQYLSDIDEESLKTGAAKIEIDKYIKSLEQKAKAEAVYSELVKIEEEILNLGKSAESTLTFFQRLTAYAEGVWKGGDLYVGSASVQTEIELKEEEENLKTLEGLQIYKKRLLSEGGSALTGSGAPPPVDSTDSVLNYYDNLIKEITKAQKVLKDLSNEQGKMDDEKIAQARIIYEELTKEKEVLELKLGLIKKTKIAEEYKVGSIGAKQSEITKLNEAYLKETDSTLRREYLMKLEAAETELNLLRGVKEESYAIVSDYYDQIKALRIKDLISTAESLNAQADEVKASLTTDSLTKTERKELTELLSKIISQIKEVNTLTADKTGDAVDATVLAFNGLGDIVSDVNGELGSVISGLAGMVSGISTLIKAGEDPLAIVSGILSVYNGLQDSFAQIGLSAEENAEKIDEMNRELEEQIKLIDEASRKGGLNDVYETGLDLLKKQREELNKTLKELQKKQSNAKSLGLWNRYENLGEEIDSITEKIIDLDETLVQMEQDYTDFLAGLITEIDIANKISQAFQDGKTSVKDFADYTNDILREAVLSVFESQILGKALTEAQEYLASALSDGELTGREVAKFEALLNESLKDAESVWDSLTGNLPDIFDTDEDEDPNSLSGSIRASLTEETGSILAGVMNSMRDDIIVMRSLQGQMVENLSGIRENTEHNKFLPLINDSIKNISDNINSLRATGNV